MLFLTRCRMRTAVSGVAAGVLAATALAFASAPAQADEASPTVTVAAAVEGGDVKITIDGTGFDPAWRDGAAGVYAGLTEKQDIFELGQEGFIGQAWVMPQQFTDGTFSTTMTVDRADLEKGAEYAVYTWTAHGNPTEGDTQYTETLVTIPSAAFKKFPAKINKKWKKKPTSKKKSALVVAVKGNGKKVNQAVTATGKVVVKVKQGKKLKKVQAKLNKKGKVTVKLPKLAKGKWKAAVKYGADKNFKKANSKFNFKVNK